MLSILMLSISVMLNVIMLSAHYFLVYAECCHATYTYAECNSHAECHYVECHIILMLY
jgi:hypothetical protein